jgi:ParB-like chromosome segregation protein Spo0J
VLIDTQDTVIAGHGRMLAAQQLGSGEVPTICLAHLKEDQRRSSRLLITVSQRMQVGINDCSVRS